MTKHAILMLVRLKANVINPYHHRSHGPLSASRHELRAV